MKGCMQWDPVYSGEDFASSGARTGTPRSFEDGRALSSSRPRSTMSNFSETTGPIVTNCHMKLPGLARNKLLFNRSR